MSYCEKETRQINEKLYHIIGYQRYKNKNTLWVNLVLFLFFITFPFSCVFVFVLIVTYLMFPSFLKSKEIKHVDLMETISAKVATSYFCLISFYINF